MISLGQSYLLGLMDCSLCVTAVFWQLLSHSSHAQRVCVMRATPWKSSKYWELLSAFPLTKASADQKVLSLRLSDMLLFARAHTSAAVRRMKKHQKRDYLCDDEPRWKFFFILLFSAWHGLLAKSMIQIPKSTEIDRKRKHSDTFLYIFRCGRFSQTQGDFCAQPASRKWRFSARHSRNISKMALLLEWELLSWFGNMTRGSADAVVRVDNPIW